MCSCVVYILNVIAIFSICTERLLNNFALVSQSAVLGILSHVKFSAHKKAMEVARIQLLVKAINEKGFGTYDYEMTHRVIITK